MNILIVSESGQNAKSFRLSTLFVFIILFITLIASLFYIYLPYLTNKYQPDNDSAVIKIIQDQQLEISNLQADAESQLENFALKLAQMQSRLIHLDTLGDKIVKVSKLNPKEFNFNRSYSLGGPDINSLQSIKKIGIEQRFAEIFEEIQIKSQQLFVIEALYDEQLYKNIVTPAGRPAEKSWISSYFGKRKDPFTGKQSRHRGIDIAAKANSKVLATATGIISWAGKRTGYGNLVEISHGNGLITRYGHCKTISVTVGQKIDQGEAIATVGSTGRSTGPHVHYEVLKNGVKINPIRYVRKKREQSSVKL